MPKAYALLGTYPPTQCGLATFNAALFDHLREFLGVRSPCHVAV